MALEQRIKDTDAITPYTVRLANPQALTVASASWTATPAGLTLAAPTQTTISTTCLISGGTLNTIYEVEAELTLSNAQVAVKRFNILVYNG